MAASRALDSVSPATKEPHVIRNCDFSDRFSPEPCGEGLGYGEWFRLVHPGMEQTRSAGPRCVPGDLRSGGVLMSEPTITLYGSPLSLYTGKARSYLIKNGLAYREVTPATSNFAKNVAPRAGRISMPTIETAEGVVIRDGTEICEYFESRMGHTATPSGPRQRIVSALLDVIGLEGLLRPAMHYRWNFPEENHNFLLFHFASMMPAGRDPEKSMEQMRQAAIAFGVVPDSIDGVEARYEALLSVLDRHFADYPYLLGGRPCLGDFGLIAPMYGHLGRDPKSLSLLQAEAIHVFRWV